MRQAEKFRNFAGAVSQTEKAMDVEEFGAYCLSLSDMTEKMPFTILNGAYGRDSADALVRRLVENFYRLVRGSLSAKSAKRCSAECREKGLFRAKCGDSGCFCVYLPAEHSDTQCPERFRSACRGAGDGKRG